MSNQFKVPEGFDAPNGSNIIWRYMSLEKFLYMLENKVTRFGRASKLTDRRELRLPFEKLESIYWKKKYGLTRERRNTDPDNDWEKLDAVRLMAEKLSKRTYLSSWSIAQEESYALWKIYLGGSRAGVAIKSTFSALQKSIKDEKGRRINCAKVNYTDEVNLENLRDEHFIYQKSAHYEYEKELRLAIDYQPDPDQMNPVLKYLRSDGDYAVDSLNVDVEINVLIREIYLSPFAINGFRKTFQQIVKKLQPELQAEVKVSAVRDS